MPQKPRIRATRTVAQTRIFRIDELELEFANGNVARFETLDSGEHASVLVVPMLDPHTMVLVREYAAAYDRYEIGFPKGLVDADEDILEAANRELMEEAGYRAGHMRQLRTLSLAPGYIRHHTHVILARDLVAERLAGDEPEPLETLTWSLDGCVDLLRRDDFTEARSVAALLLTREMIEDEQ